MRRKVERWAQRQPWWAKVAVVVVALLCSLNLTVAWVGGADVSPLSPFFLREKAVALGKYAAHRPRCLFDSHEDLPELVNTASRRQRLPPGLLASIVEVESGGRAHRISHAGAMGPGQLMSETARHLGVDDPFEPADAIDGSARYLAEQLARYRNIRLAVAAYNAGPGNVSTFVPNNGETEYYVRKVMAEYERRRPKPTSVGRPKSRPRR